MHEPLSRLPAESNLVGCIGHRRSCHTISMAMFSGNEKAAWHTITSAEG
jgi:hypothetical protein